MSLGPARPGRFFIERYPQVYHKIFITSSPAKPHRAVFKLNYPIVYLPAPLSAPYKDKGRSTCSEDG